MKTKNYIFINMLWFNFCRYRLYNKIIETKYTIELIMFISKQKDYGTFLFSFFYFCKISIINTYTFIVKNIQRKKYSLLSKRNEYKIVES